MGCQCKMVMCIASVMCLSLLFPVFSFMIEKFVLTLGMCCRIDKPFLTTWALTCCQSKYKTRKHTKPWQLLTSKLDFFDVATLCEEGKCQKCGKNKQTVKLDERASKIRRKRWRQLKALTRLGCERKRERETSQLAPKFWNVTRVSRHGDFYRTNGPT